MDYFPRAFAIVVGIEAGYSDDPADPGNWTGGARGRGGMKGTKYGISAAAYPSIDIANLTLAGAQALYQVDYWHAVNADALPWPLALFVFDCAVNQGQGTARKLLQTSLGVVVDGNVGPQTLAAAAKMKAWDMAHFMTIRARRYMDSPNFAHDGNGWFNRLFQIAMSSG